MMKTVKVGGGNHAENRPESAFEEELNQNPLLNYAIVAELMSYLPVPDLRQCRLVNSAWRTAAAPYLKKNSWLGSHMPFSLYYRRISLLRNAKTSSLYLGDLCFSKQGDRDQELTELGLFGNQNLRVFLPPFLQSSSAKKILLKFLEDYGTNFRNVLFEISIGTLELLGTVLTCLPNLVSLRIKIADYFHQTTLWHVWPSSTLQQGMLSIKRIGVVMSVGYDTEVRGSIRANNHYNFLKRLLQIAPNLETLNLKNPLRMEMHDRDDTIDFRQFENLYLRLLKDEGKALCPKLKDLHVSDYISNWDMKLLLQLDINFRQLILKNIMKRRRYAFETIQDVVGRFLQNLLERHQSSLEVLELGISSTLSSITKDEISSPMSVQFPCLPKLRKLLVAVRVASQDDIASIRFQPVDYATQFPALKELNLVYDFDEYERNPKRFDGRVDFYHQFFPDDGQVCPTLQRLSVEVPHPKVIARKSMKTAYRQFSWRLESMFPNVHNHEEVNACRVMKPSELEKFVANETRRVTRSMTKSFKSAVCDQVGTD